MQAPYTPGDFAPLNMPGLLMEEQFLAASLTYHERELAASTQGLALVRAELARRAQGVAS